MTDAPRVLATVRSYTELHEALRARFDALQVTRKGIDELIGWADGLAGKMFAPVPLKTLNATTLGPALTVAGLEMWLVESAELVAKWTDRLERRNLAFTGLRAYDSVRTKQKPTKSALLGDTLWGKEMAAIRMLKMGPKQRSRAASKAARARHRATPKAERTAMAQHMNAMRWSTPKVTEIKAPRPSRGRS